LSTTPAEREPSETLPIERRMAAFRMPICGFPRCTSPVPWSSKKSIDASENPVPLYSPSLMAEVPTDQQLSCYYSQRERAERAAAEAALSPAAKLAHERLASLYAELAERPAGAAPKAADGEAISNLVILTRE
jgi:hypothetical protein